MEEQDCYWTLFTPIIKHELLGNDFLMCPGDTCCTSEQPHLTNGLDGRAWQGLPATDLRTLYSQTLFSVFERRFSIQQTCNLPFSAYLPWHVRLCSRKQLLTLALLLVLCVVVTPWLWLTICLCPVYVCMYSCIHVFLLHLCVHKPTLLSCMFMFAYMNNLTFILEIIIVDMMNGFLHVGQP